MKNFSARYFNLVFRLLAMTFFALFSAKFARNCTKNFTISAIKSNRPYIEEHALRPLTEKEQNLVDEALSQRYHYLDSGAQVFAFVSEDGSYVIKFFKQRLFKPNWWLNHLPLPPFLHHYRNKRNFARLDKHRRDFFSYRTFFEVLQPLTEVIYCHLNPSNTMSKKLEIIDRLKIHHKIDLDQIDFVIQRKAVRVYDQIDRWMQEGNLNAAEQGISSLLSLISKRAFQGYRDRDPSISTNCGFIDGQAIKIDVGRFVKEESMATPTRHNEDLIRITAPFEKWLNENHPQLLPSFGKQLQRKLI